MTKSSMSEEARLRRALEQIERHFLPGDHRAVTYSSDARGMLIDIRETVREALGPVGCPCVGTPEQEDCPHG